ncbi:hypothetical protein B0O99DRAFT_691499 [Bisporella sp. PMI_857]|nr:hypothetical protein B0O99DRAFT_691499 [Bisporella sp. PMI_857]
MEIAEELITDYLHQFCSDLLHRFLKKEGIVKHQLKAMWYLTTPGCWSKGDQLDFQGLAQKVLVSILPDSTLSPGTWAITYDVGGLTVDTAICLTESKHNDTSRSDARDKALNFVNSSQWEAVRHEFQGETDLNITLDSSLNFKNHNVGGNSISIKGKLITVSRHLIQTLFNDFLRRMYDELDNAIRRSKEVSNRRRKSDLIALCGGGGVMAELLNKLKLRYPGIPIKTAQTIEQSSVSPIRRISYI